MSGSDIEGKSGGGSKEVGTAASAGTAQGDSAKAPTPSVTPGQWLFLAVVALTTAGLDLWTKAWAARHLSVPSHNPSPVCIAPPGAQHYLYQRIPTHETVWIQNYLDLYYAENCGGAWGLLHGAREGLRRPFFLLVTIGALGFILHLYRSLEPQQRAMRLALPLVLGGALGNLADRIRLGYVVDFIHAHWRDRFHWPTFNVADIAITVGIGLMLLEYVIGPRRPARKPVAASPAA